MAVNGITLTKKETTRYYGAFVIAPEILPPGRYPRIVFFLPGLVVAAGAAGVTWLIFYIYEEIAKRT